MTEIILHQYPASPVAEKVRVAFGIKNLSWRSVEIPRIPPKPDLIPLTGGYRRTPVMQIGADVYCDSQCILRELQKRYPDPGFFSAADEGLSWALSRWTDEKFFKDSIALVLGGAGSDLPADFAQDRGRLYFGPEWQAALKEAQKDLPHLAAQMRGQLCWINQHLAGSDFMLGDAPGLVDACVYYLVWFIRGRWQPGPELLSEFSRLEQWEQSVKALGHGNATDLDAKDALAIARNSQSVTPELSDSFDTQGITPGTRITVRPDIDGGEVFVTGDVHYISSDTIGLRRESDETGEVCVHFPRVGYRVDVLT